VDTLLDLFSASSWVIRQAHTFTSLHTVPFELNIGYLTSLRGIVLQQYPDSSIRQLDQFSLLLLLGCRGPHCSRLFTFVICNKF
jgi:hypothetical protein